MMSIVIGADHAGFPLKEDCKAFMQKDAEYQVEDMGVYNTQSYDYPKIAHKLAKAVSEGHYSRGILICGSGIGMSMVANRYKGVRAALCDNLYSARMCRLHNDANILTMGGRVLGVGLALEILDLFLKTEFEGGRHKTRVDQIDTGGSSF